MAAPNKQPAGSRPGPKAPNTHAPHEGGAPAGGHSPAPRGGHSGVAGGVAPHGTPSPVGNGKKNPLR